MLPVNHIGMVVKDIDRYIKNSWYEQAHKRVFDPIQRAHIALIELPGQPDIELIQPEDEQATTFNFLKKTGGGLHHICYEAPDQIVLEELMVRFHIKPIFGPVEAVLFENRKVLFGYNRNREIVEFLIAEHGQS